MESTINTLNVFWFAAGLLTALAAAFVLLPLAASPGMALAQRVRQVRWPVLAALLIVPAAVALYAWRGNPTPAGLNPGGGAMAVAHPGMPGLAPGASMAGAGAGAGAGGAAGSMDVVLKHLEQRLASQGGSDADWQLLAQTYDFLGRKQDAELARTRHQLPAGAGAPSGAGVPSGAVDQSGPAANAAAQAAAASPKAKALRARAEKERGARHFAAAAEAYAQLAHLGALDAQGWADYADVSATLNGDRLAGAPEQKIAAALALDPANEKALWLLASVQHETHRYADAIGSWQRLLQLTPADSSDAKIFAANLKEDQGLAGASGATGAAVVSATAVPATAVPAEAASDAVVTGQVQLAAALRGKVPTGLTLFVVAKSVDSPGPPVAVLRTSTGQWPTAFRLDDSLAMLPGRNLSSAQRVTVEARVSRSGTAFPQAGDFQSAVIMVDPRAHGTVHLLIDHIVGSG